VLRSSHVRTHFLSVLRARSHGQRVKTRNTRPAGRLNPPRLRSPPACPGSAHAWRGCCRSPPHTTATAGRQPASHRSHPANPYLKQAVPARRTHNSAAGLPAPCMGSRLWESQGVGGALHSSDGTAAHTRSPVLLEGSRRAVATAPSFSNCKGWCGVEEPTVTRGRATHGRMAAGALRQPRATAGVTINTRAHLLSQGAQPPPLSSGARRRR